MFHTFVIACKQIKYDCTHVLSCQWNGWPSTQSTCTPQPHLAAPVLPTIPQPEKPPQLVLSSEKQHHDILDDGASCHAPRPPELGSPQEERQIIMSSCHHSLRLPELGPSLEEPHVIVSSCHQSPRPPELGPSQEQHVSLSSCHHMLQPPELGPSLEERHIIWSSCHHAPRPPELGPSQEERRIILPSCHHAPRPPELGPFQEVHTLHRDRQFNSLHALQVLQHSPRPPDSVNAAHTKVQQPSPCHHRLAIQYLPFPPDHISPLNCPKCCLMPIHLDNVTFSLG